MARAGGTRVRISRTASTAQALILAPKINVPAHLLVSAQELQYKLVSLMKWKA
jgi:hypothetical protein